ncbi:MAG TPA: hypothetical protein VF377_10170 [Acidimicrobiia bacterium]|jgi:hypothetical protein
MYRLGELTEQQRSRYGWSMMVLGTFFLAIGVILVHYANLPADAPRVGIFWWIPRGWLPKGLGYLIGFGASQLLIAGAAIAFVLGRRMTWALATFAAFLAWIEFVLIFGIVPSEWLNLAQTDLDWSVQRIAFTIPPWLVLGNEVQVSWGAIKDSISMGYNLVALVGAAVFAYKLQDIGKGAPARPEEPQPVSPYGRPLVRGDS